VRVWLWLEEFGWEEVVELEVVEEVLLGGEGAVVRGLGISSSSSSA
jgi:hypothetical protein